MVPAPGKAVAQANSSMAAKTEQPRNSPVSAPGTSEARQFWAKAFW